jgi:predicted Zn-dependent peptidase
MTAMTDFHVAHDPVSGEEVWRAQCKNGLRLRLVPTARFAEAVAVVTVGYGSTDLGFVDGAGAHRSPEGVAHYLEHKLFEAEDLHTFDRFARRGAKVNAVTGFARTSYWFAATHAFADNLRDLLRLVATPHITSANVEKERGIIAQEIKMYEDAPGYRAFFDLLRCLYAEHPVRHPVGGTVDSIAAITAGELLRCHAAFYRASNAVLAAVGPIDVHEVAALAEGNGLAAGAVLPSVCPADLEPPRAPAHVRYGQVARARVLLGAKETTLLDGEAMARRHLLTTMLLDLLLGPAAPVRDELARQGIADDTLSCSALAERSFGFAVVGGETDDPERFTTAVREVLLRPATIGADDVERVRRKHLGAYVRGFEAARPQAFGHAEDELAGIAPFCMPRLLAGVCASDLQARQRELLTAEALAVASVLPAPSSPA